MFETIMPYLEYDGSLRTVKQAHIKELAAHLSISVRETEIRLLESDIIPLKYVGNVRTIGLPAMISLRRAKVAVIGCGGLGSMLVEILCRAGVGELILFDGDEFDESNLNRQINCTQETIGKNKAYCAKTRVLSIDPFTEVRAYPDFLRADNGKAALIGCACVCDALDNKKSRLLLEQVCGAIQVPIVHGAIGGSMLQAVVCPPGSGYFSALYGSGASEVNIPVGNLITPFLCATIQAAECIKHIAGIGDGLNGKLLCFDWMRYDLSLIPLEACRVKE